MTKKIRFVFLFFTLSILFAVSGCATNPYIGFGAYKSMSPRGNIGLGVGIGLDR